jgi:biotin carboxyl carrier protein
MALGILILGTGAGLLMHFAPADEPLQAATQRSTLSQEQDSRDKARTPAVAVPVQKADELDNVVQVASQREGIMSRIGTELKLGEKASIKELVPGTDGKLRRLKVGDRVERGQLLARLDDRLADDEYQIKKAKVVAAEAELESSRKTCAEAKRRHEIAKANFTRGLTTQEDVGAAELTWARYDSETVSKVQQVKVAELEMRQAQTILKMHQIRSPVAGVIKKICKHAGEAARSLETIVVIEASE